MKVSACLVTRGDVDLTEPLAAIADAGIGDVVIWDNSAEQDDVAVYGRYAAISRAYGERIYVQDDDCVIAPHAIQTLIAAAKPGVITANMPQSRWGDYPDSCLVGWGAVFDRRLPVLVFNRYADHYSWSPRFDRECDVVFTVLTPHQKLDLGFTHLPWAEDPNRAMFLRDWRKAERDLMYEQARAVRDA